MLQRLLQMEFMASFESGVPLKILFQFSPVIQVKNASEFFFFNNFATFPIVLISVTDNIMAEPSFF